MFMLYAHECGRLRVTDPLAVVEDRCGHKKRVMNVSHE